MLLILNLVIMAVILGYIGILQKMLILKCLMGIDINVPTANNKAGSQSHIVNPTANNSIVSLIVYYEAPEGQRDEIKHKFNSFVKKFMVLQ
jgi:hypothetical protein